MKRTRSVGALLITVLLLGTACSGNEPATSDESDAAATPQASEPSAPGESAEPATFEDSEEWQQLIADAQAEGELVIVASVGNSGSQTEIWQHFGETFGIEVVESTGSTSDVNARVLTEQSQGLFAVDVGICGTSCQTGFMEGGALRELAPLLIHPDIEDRSLWHLEEFPWLPTDAEKKYISEYLLRVEPNIFRTFYNTENVTQEDLDSLTSYWDFVENDRWHGRIVTENPVIDDGTGTELARGWIEFGGPDFFDRLYREAQPDVAGVGVERDMVDAMARGQYDVSFLATGATTPAANAMEQGLPIAQLTKTLAEGAPTDLTGHFSAFREPPHPAAQKLFINWILSHEGQTKVNELLVIEASVGTLALRNDVAQGAIPDDTWATVTSPDFEVVLEDEEEVVAATDEARAFLRELFVELGYEAGG